MAGPYSVVASGLTAASDTLEDILAQRYAQQALAREQATKDRQTQFDNLIKAGQLNATQQTADTGTTNAETERWKAQHPEDSVDAVTGVLGDANGPYPGQHVTQMRSHRTGALVSEIPATTPTRLVTGVAGPGGTKVDQIVNDTPGQSFAEAPDLVPTVDASGNETYRPKIAGLVSMRRPELGWVRQPDQSEVYQALTPGTTQAPLAKQPELDTTIMPDGTKVTTPKFPGTVTAAPTAGIIPRIGNFFNPGSFGGGPIADTMRKYPIGTPVNNNGRVGKVAGYNLDGTITIAYQVP